MKILAVADVEERVLWDFYSEERFGDIDLILSAGDLKAEYLEFLVTMINRPLLYVQGNHDDAYARHAPGGCICIDDSVYVHQGVRIAGLGGCMRYRHGDNMYTEHDMNRRLRRLSPQVNLLGGIDVLLTHAPAFGLGDMDDLPHTGFDCFNDALDRWRPAYMVHGHVHQGYRPLFERRLVAPGGTAVINACGYTVIDIVEDGSAPDWRTRFVNALCMRHADAAHARTSADFDACW